MCSLCPDAAISDEVEARELVERDGSNPIMVSCRELGVSSGSASTVSSTFAMRRARQTRPTRTDIFADTTEVIV